MTIQSAKAQVQAVPFVDTALCQACPRCQARTVCKSKALLQLDPGEQAFVDASRCYGCNACLPTCPSGAVRLQPT